MMTNEFSDMANVPPVIKCCLRSIIDVLFHVHVCIKYDPNIPCNA